MAKSAGELRSRDRGALVGRVGVALGSGAARGWAHIGVLRALEERGIRPSVVAGTSMGAAVGAAWASGHLDPLEDWVRGLERRQVLSFLDVTVRGGGLISAQRVLDAYARSVPDVDIESLPMPFGAVATDLETGRELWLREGSLLEAVRASVAIPGMVTPRRVGGSWLVDGGLVNPVPVSLCRALGADSVIAVDLNTTLLGRRISSTRPEVVGLPAAGGAAGEGEEDGEDAGPPAETAAGPLVSAAEADAEETSGPTSSLRNAIGELLADLRRRALPEDTAEREAPPSIYEVAVNAINIMQVRITRSRMAGDPPELYVVPRLGDFALLDFDRGVEAIDEGRRAVAQALAPE